MVIKKRFLSEITVQTYLATFRYIYGHQLLINGDFGTFWASCVVLGHFFTIGPPKWARFGHLEKNVQYHLTDPTKLSTSEK